VRGIVRAWQVGAVHPRSQGMEPGRDPDAVAGGRCRGRFRRAGRRAQHPTTRYRRPRCERLPGCGAAPPGERPRRIAPAVVAGGVSSAAEPYPARRPRSSRAATGGVRSSCVGSY